MATPLRVDIERHHRPRPLHRVWGLEDQCLTGLCRKLVEAGYPDSPAYTWDGTATGYGMRIKSVHRYARLTIHEEAGGGIPRMAQFVPFTRPVRADLKAAELGQLPAHPEHPFAVCGGAQDRRSALGPTQP